MSCVVAGFDIQRWTAFCFTDTYFEDVQDAQIDPPGDYRTDLLIGASEDANKPIWDPRHYFMKVLRNRLSQVTNEWRFVVQNMKESVREYEVCPLLRLHTEGPVISASRNFPIQLLLLRHILVPAILEPLLT